MQTKFQGKSSRDMRLELVDQIVDDDGKVQVWFILWCHYLDREIPRRAGFQWCPANKVWQTTDSKIARFFIDYADPAAVAFLNPQLCRHGINANRADCFACAREIRNEGLELDAEFREAIQGG
jgi:hypothetical protein